MPVLMITLIIYLLYVVLGNGVLHFLLQVFSIINKKGRFYPDFVLLCLFWKNGKTKNQKSKKNSL